MNCDEARPLLDASMDRELSAADDWRVRQHLAGCVDCQRDSATLRTVADAMRSVSYQRAPDSLRMSIVAALPSTASVTSAVSATGDVAGRGNGFGVGNSFGDGGAASEAASRPAASDNRAGKRPAHEIWRGWRRFLPSGGSGGAGGSGRPAWAGAGASGADDARAAGIGWRVALGLAICAAAVAVTVSLHRPADSGPFVDELVASHVRAELSGRDIDVISTDRHTVKPWFNGRIDYAPPVVDLAHEGFALVGGRLDYVGHERVAVLVYQYRKHMIDVYVFPPGARAADGPAPAAPRDGYAVARWQADGMAWWAVSDAEADALKSLEAALKAHSQSAEQEQDAPRG